MGWGLEGGAGDGMGEGWGAGHKLLVSWARPQQGEQAGLHDIRQKRW